MAHETTPSHELTLGTVVRTFPYLGPQTATPVRAVVLGQDNDMANEWLVAVEDDEHGGWQVLRRLVHELEVVHTPLEEALIACHERITHLVEHNHDKDVRIEELEEQLAHLKGGLNVGQLAEVGLVIHSRAWVEELIGKAKAYDHLCTRLMDAPAIPAMVTTTLSTVRKLARGLMSYSGDFYTRKETMVELIDNLIGADPTVAANDDTALAAAQ